MVIFSQLGQNVSYLQQERSQQEQLIMSHAYYPYLINSDLQTFWSNFIFNFRNAVFISITGLHDNTDKSNICKTASMGRSGGLFK